LDRLNSMSPAARRLASTQLRRRIGSDLALLASYSPSPQHSIRSGQPSPQLTNTPTPGKNGSVRRNQIATPNLNITDNLLNLPKRPRAADFFWIFIEVSWYLYIFYKEFNHSISAQEQFTILVRQYLSTCVMW
jgi:hypothetical protein